MAVEIKAAITLVPHSKRHHGGLRWAAEPLYFGASAERGASEEK